jgi:hypothetical protein
MHIPTTVRFRAAPLAAAALSLMLAACGGGAGPERFANGTPRFEPEKFFAGRVRSRGVFEDRSARPTRRFTTEIVGRPDGDALVIEQHFVFHDGTTQQRVWRLRRLDEHRYEATAGDVVGPAAGEAWGNLFHWTYTLALDPGNPLKNVDLEQWMYLQDDGETMVNRATIGKFGVIAAEVTEFFRRVPADVPSAPGGH